jgi:sorbitol-specific phosphotransferase system component IIC
MHAPTPAIRWGFIEDLRTDLVWFLALPYIAVAIALGTQRFSPTPLFALASFNLWITIPHHYATWVRTYGLREDWARWKLRLILGPLVLLAAIVPGFLWAPITTALLVAAWDHQHSLMQQHGLARIYDFKAKAGAPVTRRYDLWLNIFLYVNLLLTAPLWVGTWYGELQRWEIPIAVSTVRSIGTLSWSVTAAFLFVYLGHVVWCVWHGYALNPLKYLFVLSSYALWYYTSWHTFSLLVFGVAHRIMHGVQYMVIVYLYLQRRETRSHQRPRVFPRVSVLYFTLIGVGYAVAFQLIGGFPLSQFTFGITALFEAYPAVPELGLGPVDSDRAYDIYAATVVNLAATLHYYVDSFIWKVSDPKTQEGL